MFICFDLDGTILNDYGELSPSSQRDIKSLAENGHELAIATARPTFGLSVLGNTLKYFTVIVTFQGAYVTKKLKSGLMETAFKRTIDSLVLKSCIDCASHYGSDIWAFCHDRWYIKNTCELSVQESKLLQVSPDKVSLEYFKQLKPLKLIIPQPSKLMGDAISRIKGINIEYSNHGRYCEITSAGITKSTWLKGSLINYSKPSIAVGDSDNDICMFNIVTHSFAVTTGTKLAVSHANFHIERDANHGIKNLVKVFDKVL